MKTGNVKLGLALLFLFLIATTAFAVPDDSVLSQHVMEADGTSGQNTNSGSGIKTGHIQDGAVTAGKIVDAAVTTTKISDSAVTTGKIADSAVTNGKISDGAVTDAKITGPISASKISSAGLNADTVDGMHAVDLAPAVHTHSQAQVTGLEAALAGKSDVTHNHDALYQQKYGKVAVVAQTGGDYTSPVTAMNALAVWCGTPSAANRCLLKIQPGVYDLSGGSLQTQSYVDVEGSGENATVIKSTTSVVQCADNVEVRFLTVESTGGVSTPNAIYITGSTRLTHLTARTSGGLNDNIGILTHFGFPILTDVTVDLQIESSAKNWGIVSNVNTNTVTMRNVIITVGNGSTNYGIGAFAGKLILNNVSTNAFGGGLFNRGIWNSGGTLSITNSYINSDYAGIAAESPVSIQNSTVKGYYSLENARSTTKVSLSQLDGPFSNSSGLTCFNAYDANFMPITCP